MKINSMNNNNTSISAYLFGWLAMIFGRFTLEEWMMIIGLIATIGGFLINWYYKHQDFKLKKRALGINRDDNKEKGSK